MNLVKKIKAIKQYINGSWQEFILNDFATVEDIDALFN